MMSACPPRLLVWLLLFTTPLGATPSQAQATTRASLLLAAEVTRPGDTVLAAVRLKMARGWHTYWRNPGESGKATEIQWQLPTGFSAGPIQWPAPEAYTASEMTTYVYHDEVLLLVPLSVASNTPAGRHEIRASVDWLECDVACVPGDAVVTSTIEVGAATRPSADAGLIARWEKRIPRPDLAFAVTAAWESPPVADSGTLLITGKIQPAFTPADFYAYEGDGFEVAPPVTAGESPDGTFRLAKKVRSFGKPLPGVISGILVPTDRKTATATAVEVRLDLGGGAGTRAEPTPQSPAGGTASASLLGMLGLAFLGGLILNIMPCVLPVIALKVLGFVQQSREAPERVRKLGVIYALGVLASFLVLAGLVIQVQQAGGGASWGMQMQNPYFRLGLLVVVLLVALNLFGLFEITLPGRAMGAAAGLASKEGSAGAFFNGVLATALATPCTAPFLAVALGFAFTQPAWVILLTFVAVAAGLAAPYVLLSWKPGWLRFLPKPGAWMLRFKVAMGFPMLATAIWLFDFTAPSFGAGGWLWLGVFLVVLALVAWIWGEFVQRGSSRQGLAIGICLTLLAFNYGYILEAQLHWRSPEPVQAESEVIRDSPDGIPWYRWSPDAVDQARRAGQPVLVDFTAKWCFTCKSNKKLAIDIPEVRERLKGINAKAFRADNTDPSPRILAELKRYGRAGVPLVLIFPPSPERPPEVLPELLTPGLVLDAIDRAVAPR